MFGALRQYQHVFAATLAGQFQLDVDLAQARGYDTALEAYLDKDDIDDCRLQQPGVDHQCQFAIAPPLRRAAQEGARSRRHPPLRPLYPDRRRRRHRGVLSRGSQASSSPPSNRLGEDYGRALAEGLDPANGWMDLYPHKDKRSGAFSASVYGPHPYVFMNYQDSIDDMSTLAHEFGHALHSYLAMKSPALRRLPLRAVPGRRSPRPATSRCFRTIWWATPPTRRRRPRCWSSVWRGSGPRSSARPCLRSSNRRYTDTSKRGTPVTAALLEETYSDLVRRYYGPGIRLDADDGMEWAYIPHFYYKYYVYSYATGLTSGIAIADRVKRLGEPAAAAVPRHARGRGVGSSARTVGGRRASTSRRPTLSMLP